jgi:hypothetical protein
MNRYQLKELNTIKPCFDLVIEKDKNNFDPIGLRVMVYYNLHKKTFSVQHKGRVILYSDYIKLGNVEFRVRESGRKKVRKEMKKNVHAFVIGDLIDYCEYPCENIPPETNDKIITYDPYKYDSFVKKDTEESIYNTNEIDMINTINKIFQINEIVN